MVACGEAKCKPRCLTRRCSRSRKAGAAERPLVSRILESFVEPPVDRPHDFEAMIKALPTSAGGRRHPMYSGYRPSHDLGLAEGSCDATHVYPEGGAIEPGASGPALVWLLSPELQAGRLFVGMEFTVREGPHIVGHGIITRVESSALQRPAHPAS